MNEKKIQSVLLSLFLMGGCTAVYAGAVDEHSDTLELSLVETQDHDDVEAEDGVIHISPQQREMIGLKVERVSLKDMAQTLRVPGEVTFNAYRSSVISPRSDVRVVKRHVMLGDHVKEGAPLITLFSKELAERLSELRVAEKEWELVNKMGRKLAGKQRFVATKSAFLQAKAQVKSFGLSETEIQQQLNNSHSESLGEFALRAPHDGVVQRDDFLVGQQLAAGDQLIVLVDEQEIWVEAQVSPNHPINSPVGTAVQLQIGNGAYTGSLQQVAHTIDEMTRTRMVRITVDNSNHALHPGQFAQVDVPTRETKPQLVLPESAFTRTPDGDWGVFVEQQPGEYKLQEVEVIRDLRGQRIVDGIKAGTPVVVAGTFFLSSEQSKSGFDIHNH
ncbi:efflux RND transporter periplasmic adaptor subunit [Pontibacterium granulatum]|uniref:efflux RND transporter periplasmic adaptor subunit n=1 Tax=Pontibacterium granulatum TaxID=2036029 RepID=UPI00249BB01B|nr:efflux RND transporter periplasmic adaptor subunit [Pontibacterium granulatum]MDI3326305.1 efflux RND transporter periplasmic adaptor subunit [Pontibacterium granulatum]